MLIGIGISNDSAEFDSLPANQSFHEVAIMYGYRLVWVNAQKIENTKFFSRYDTMMGFVSAQNESRNLLSFVYYTH